MSIRESELDDDHEQLLVRDGMVVGLQQPNGSFVDETGVQVGAEDFCSKSSWHICHDMTQSWIEYACKWSANWYQICVADEVESYPCPLCPERVFLTSFGLERHSTEKHPEHLQEILEHIDVIGEEWRRREEEIARRRDRVYATRLRQESIARHAIEQVANGTLGQFPERRFKACSQCGILVDANSPAAMESHLRAHKKNDDLKMKLLARYGPEEVGRLICRECNMVFGDESGLLVHNEQMHIRKRK
ncbi:unnamed protein product [Angiostrongylus costaricensis]|uniref:C2H2-type domain-containing protein n=1 Tax=Angiostrongylus costaricensis TaxID=334426 RepID=A0A0R3PAQ5_ANGCS|nr:unnamed protein product [Angiostrongylus costaricensis]